MPREIIVKEGDTLNKIAQAQGFKNFKDAGVTSVPSGNFDLIRPGEKIVFGNLEADKPKPTADTTVDEAIESPGVVSTDGIRKDIKKRGEEPADTKFGDQDEFETFKERFEPEGTTPTRTGGTRVEQFEQLRADQGIEGIEENLSKNIEEQELLRANFEKFAVKEAEGQPLGFATGRITEEEKNVNERIRTLQREERTLTDRLNSRNAVIETTMKLTDADFKDASKAYSDEFERNLSLFNAFEKQEDKDLAFEKANYNTVYNMMTKSGKTWEDLPNDMKAQIGTSEVKLGIPVGTFEELARSNPKANIVQQGKSVDASGNEFAWTILENEDGTPEIVKTPTGGFKKPTSTKTSEDKEKDRIQEFKDAEDFVKANPDASREELEVELRKNSDLSSGDITSILDAHEKTTKESKPIVEQISDFLEDAKKQGLSRKEAEAKIKASLEKKLGTLTGDRKDLIEDELVNIYGRTTLQKIIPGGR